MQSSDWFGVHKLKMQFLEPFHLHSLLNLKAFLNTWAVEYIINENTLLLTIGGIFMPNAPPPKERIQQWRNHAGK